MPLENRCQDLFVPDSIVRPSKGNAANESTKQKIAVNNKPPKIVEENANTSSCNFYRELHPQKLE